MSNSNSNLELKAVMSEIYHCRSRLQNEVKQLEYLYGVINSIIIKHCTHDYVIDSSRKDPSSTPKICIYCGDLK